MKPANGTAIHDCVITSLNVPALTELAERLRQVGVSDLGHVVISERPDGSIAISGIPRVPRLNGQVVTWEGMPT